MTSTAFDPTRLLIALVCLLLVCTIALHAETKPDDEDDEEIEVERWLEIEIRLIGVERLPQPGSTAIARFRVVSGEYRGALFSLAYDHERPVQLRSWDMHDPSGYRRIGGARILAPSRGQWDALFPRGSDEPLDTLVVGLVQTDLNEDEEDRRWHFTAVEWILPLDVYRFLDPFEEMPREAPVFSER